MQVLASDELTVRISSLGAELCSIKDKSGLEYLWQADKTIWPRHAPVLFPIVGKLNNNSFAFNDECYTLNQHGFARDMEFTPVEKTGSSCTFALSANQQTREAFPFDFKLRISYVLNGNTLNTIYDVENPSATQTLFFSIGAHPGFNCPIVPGEKFEDHVLVFTRLDLTQTLLTDGLRQGSRALALKENKLPLTHKVFDNDALVFENGQIGEISLCSTTSSHQVHLRCEGWPYFGIWSKKGMAPFVCLEPWYGICDRAGDDLTLPEKDGIRALAPGKQFSCSFSLRFS